MAKFENTDEDIIKNFEDIKTKKTAIPEWIKFKCLTNEKQPHPMRLFKASELVNHLTTIDIIVIFNETMFNQLDKSLQDILIEETIAQVYYDSEKDKITLLKPDITTFSGIVKKYNEEYYRLFECVKSLEEQFKMANKKGKN